MRRDREFTKLINTIKEVEGVLGETEKERKKQQEAIFGVMDMIQISGGMMPVKADVECQTEVSVACRYANIFTEVPQPELYTNAVSILHRLACVKPTEQAKRELKLTKKNTTLVNQATEDQLLKNLSLVMPKDSLSWIAKLMMEKSKKDFLNKKSNCETSSIDEFTALSLLEENQTVKESSEVLVHHFNNLHSALKEGHPFAEVVCKLYGLFSKPRLQKDLSDYVLTAFREFSGSTNVSLLATYSKGLSDFI